MNPIAVISLLIGAFVWIVTFNTLKNLHDREDWR